MMCSKPASVLAVHTATIRTCVASFICLDATLYVNEKQNYVRINLIGILLDQNLVDSVAYI